MRTNRLRVLAVCAVALVASAGVASSQAVAKSPDLLAASEVRALVANAKTPADHLRLSRHFSALAEKYTTDASEHKALAAVYRKAPTASETKRPMAPDTAAHCDRFARLASEAASEARDMAKAHERMATAQ